MGTLSEERKAMVAVGGLYGRAPGARLPMRGPLDDGSCRTWQFRAHANGDGTVTMQDTYWGLAARDLHGACYELDDDTFDELFPKFTLLAADLGEWRAVREAERRLYADADLVEVLGGARGGSRWMVRRDASPDPAYAVNAAKCDLDSAVCRARSALGDVRRLLGELDGLVAEAEAAGLDWDGSRDAAECAARLAGSPRMRPSEAGCAGEVDLVAARGNCGWTTIDDGDEVVPVPCADPDLSAWAVLPGRRHGRFGYIVLAGEGGPVGGCDLTPANMDAVASLGCLAGAPFEAVDMRVSGNSGVGKVAAGARELLGEA